MADSPPGLIGPSAEQRRIAAERFEHARKAAASEKNFDYAIQLLLTCCKLDPANLVYRRELRRCQKAKHKNNLRGGFFAFLTTAPYKTKLKAAKRGRDYRKVLEHGEEVLARNPWDSGTQMDMGEAADALGLLDMAVFILDQAREKNPKDATVNRALARLLEKRGDFTTAIKLWELVRQVRPDDVEAGHKAKDLAASETIRRGQYEDAGKFEVPGHVAQKMPPGSATHKVLNDLDKLSNRVDDDPSDAEAVLQLAAHHRKQGDLEAAARVLQRGLGPTGNDFRLQVELGEIELEPFRQNLSLTEERLRAAPGDDELRKVRIKLLKEINTRETDLLRLKADRQPNDLSLRLDLGVRLLRANQTDAAIQELQAARKDAKLQWKASMYLGYCFKGRNNWRLAERSFTDALNAVPDGDEALRKEILFQLAQGAAEAGDWPKAVDHGHELANLDFGYREIGKLLDQWQAKVTV